MNSIQEEGVEIPSSKPSFSSRLFRFYHTFGLAVVSVVLVVCVVQIQVLQHKINGFQSQIDDLVTQVNQQQEQGQQLNYRVEREHSLTLYQMAGTFVVLACCLSAFHISAHLRNYHEPIVQRKIVAILWMVPVYATTSFFSLLFPSVEGYLGVIKDFYEAYVVYTFLSFLIAVLGRGNRDVAVNVLARHASHLKKPFRCLNGFFHPSPDTSDNAMANAVLLECQILCMQFVFVRPMTSIASFVATSLADDDEISIDSNFFTSPIFFIAMVTNVSVFLAFTGLMKLYHAIKDDVGWMNPLNKFLTIKGIVFLTFWQGLLISIIVGLQSSAETGTATDITSDASMSNSTRFLEDTVDIIADAKSPHEKAQEIQDVLICLEMLVFAIGHFCFFPTEEWEEGYRPKEYAKPGIGLKDFVSDMSFIVSSSSSARASRRELREDSSSLDTEENIEEPKGGALYHATEQ